MSLKSKIILIIVIILVIVLVGYTFAQISENEKSVIKIGSALPLTGKMASFGEDMKNGFDLALSEINQENKYQLEIIYEDTQAEADIAVSTVTTPPLEEQVRNFTFRAETVAPQPRLSWWQDYRLHSLLLVLLATALVIAHA